MKARQGPLAAALCIVPLLSGCALFSSQVELSSRYKHYKNDLVDCRVAVAASRYCYESTVSALPASGADNSLAATALSDRGQDAYIAALAEAAKEDSAAFKGALAAPA